MISQYVHSNSLDERSKQLGRLSLLAFILVIGLTIYGVNAQNSNIGWDLSNSNTTADINDIVHLNNSTAWAVGNNGLILHTIDGYNWTTISSPTNENLYAIDMINGTIFISGANGIVLKGDGTTFTSVSPSETRDLFGISIAKANDKDHAYVFVVGENGVIWYTNNSGTTWFSQDSHITTNLLDVDFLNATVGLAVGDNGTIIGTLTGGNEWDIRDIPNEAKQYTIRAVLLKSEVRAYAVGDNGLFLRSSISDNPNIGFSWKVWATGVSTQFNDISGSSINKIWVVGNNGTVMLTKDGGNSFSIQAINSTVGTENLLGISIVDSDYGYIVGTSGTILFTNRGGVAESSLPTVKNYSDFGVFLNDIIPYLVSGFIGMVKIIFFSMALGFTLGILLALFKTTHNSILKFIAMVYSDFFRNTPLLVQIFIIHFGLPEIGIDLSFGGSVERALMSSIFALGLNSAAYQSEIIRSGIQAIPAGQNEAGRSIGLTYLQTMRYVILPQALRIVIPPLGNEFVNMTLNSSLASLTGYFELVRAGRVVIAITFKNFWTWSLVALFFFVITYSLTNLLRYIEKKTKIPGLGMGER